MFAPKRTPPPAPPTRWRAGDRELDRRLHDAVIELTAELPSLAAAVREARARVFPSHCPQCDELPHEDGSRCPARP
jgi:hypothetical protein